MTDNVTLARIDALHPQIKEEVLDIYKYQIVPTLSSNVYCRFAYTLRTFEQQNEMYAQGRTKLFDNLGKRVGKITNAKGGQSYHNYGLALDIVLINGRNASWSDSIDFDNDGVADWMEIVKIFKDNGWEWGGDWIGLIDKPHFQKTFGYSWQQLFEKYNTKQFIPGTNYVKL